MISKVKISALKVKHFYAKTQLNLILEFLLYLLKVNIRFCTQISYHINAWGTFTLIHYSAFSAAKAM